MKKSFLFLAVLLSCVLFSTAQDEPKKIFIGGHFSVSSSNRDYDEGDSKSFGFTISPAIGYFVGERWLIGLNAIYSYQKSETVHTDIDSDRDVTTNNYLFGPFARYYIPLGEKIKIYTEFETLYGINKRKISDKTGTEEPFNSESDRKLLHLVLTPGLSYNITKSLLIEAEFGAVGFRYMDYNSDDDYGNTSSSKDTSFGISLNTLSFGLALLL